jgi:hypothetical protein
MDGWGEDTPYLDDAEQLFALLRFPFPKLKVNILRLVLGCR